MTRVPPGAEPRGGRGDAARGSADPSSIRRWNERTVVQALRGAGATRISALAAATGLTPAAARDVVRSLERKGWIAPGPAGTSGMGRPARTIRLASADIGVLGVDLGGHTVRLAATRGSEPPRSLVEVPVAGATLADTREALSQALSLAMAQVPQDRVWTTGLALSGASDDSGRLTHSLALPHLVGLRPAEALADLLPGHVVACHDTRSALWAEHVEGAARGEEDTLLLSLGRRPSVALLLGGRLHLGRHGTAGELTLNTLLPAHLDPRSTHGDQAPLLAGAVAGDPQALAAARGFLVSLAAPLALAIGLVDPGLVVVGGALGHAIGQLPPEFLAQLSSRLERPPRVVTTGLDQFAVARGAALLAREALWQRLVQGADGVLPLAPSSLATASLG